MPQQETPSSDTLSIDSRYCGPPDSANGGYVGGLLATALGATTATLSLKAPVPVDRPLRLQHTTQGVELLHDQTLLASAAADELLLDLPPPCSFAEAERVAGRCLGLQNHPFVNDFVSGPARQPGDGLLISPGPLDAVRVAAPFRVHPALCDPDGQLSTALIWAALDSSSSFPLLEEPAAAAMVPWGLGRLTVTVTGTLAANETAVTIAWSLGREGRKGHAAAALYNGAGQAIAWSRALWISLKKSP